MNNIYKINDKVEANFLKLPSAFFQNPKYSTLSSDAKVVYALLQNRMKLSMKNGWCNENGEIYIIYTRRDLSEICAFSYKKTVSVIKELFNFGLLFEKRQGRGFPNFIYLARPEENEVDNFEENVENNVENEENCGNAFSEYPEMTHQELPKSTYQELSKLPTIKKDNIKNEKSIDKDNDNDFLFSRTREKQKNKPRFEALEIKTDKPDISPADKSLSNTTDEEILEKIYLKCEFYAFKPKMHNIIKNAVERLYYSESFKIGDITLSNESVRRCLNLINGQIVENVLVKMQDNKKNISRPIKYAMTMLINEICDYDAERIFSLPKRYTENEIFAPPQELEELFKCYAEIPDD